VLYCEGDYITADGTREPHASLIKVHPGNEYQTSIHYYNDNEKRFASLCQDQGYACKFQVGNELITEVGEMGNDQVSMTKLTQINRITGKMTVQIGGGGMPMKPIYEYDCEKSEMPQEVKPKF
jgi:hypothetical protein